MIYRLVLLYPPLHRQKQQKTYEMRCLVYNLIGYRSHNLGNTVVIMYVCNLQVCLNLFTHTCIVVV